MTDSDEITDWRKLREFAAVDLTKSFLLSCETMSSTLLIEVDLLLTPDHPFYEMPRPAQRVCIRPAVIEFPYCDSITGDGLEAGRTPAAAAGSIGHGAITGFQRLADGRYCICGEFGELFIDAERPILRIKGK